ncbi:DUF3644 domain-containing protein [Citrobacter sp. EC_71]|uniref:DUF3644 domain-containing protein n=1 Tax=unclassified Citrobacter TaxID=2644389 RepID=UPI0010C9489D|nr:MULTISPECIES: DUF3644 domain-containing protein [unclassified Citrobacter]MBW9350305.1 DUF3644 domain-containing protein [Citrobacter sp. EC_71]TKV11764.1 DUF3644 domain-containing protein [Citrobacter sp. wls615]
MARTANQLKLLDVLRRFEKSKKLFTITELATETGYTENSIRKYINEKLNGIYVNSSNGKLWKCEGIQKISNDDFICLMSQSLKAKNLTPEIKIYKSLLKRSLDAFVLSLEVYNRPTLDNRVEAFCILSVNAWELLLKAELLKYSGMDAVFKKNGYSVSITDAINKRLQQNDPVKKNLDTLIELRDGAIHLLLPELQPELSRLFQANVLNYQQRYLKETGMSPLAGQSVGMLSLVVDGPKSDISTIKENYGEMTANVAREFLTRFHKASKEQNSNEFSISIDYKLTLTKCEKDSDLSLGLGNQGSNAIIIRETRDPDITHPYYQGSAIEKINRQQKNVVLTKFSFTAITKKHNIQKAKRSDMHYTIDNRHRYSEKFIQWVIKNLEQPGWIEESTAHYKKIIKK